MSASLTPALNPLLGNQKVLIVPFKHGLSLQVSCPLCPAQLLICNSLWNIKGNPQEEGRAPDRWLSSALSPLPTLFLASGHLLSVKGLNLSQIFSCIFKRTVVTILFMCGELHNSSKSLSMNILSHSILPASQAGKKTYTLVRSLDLACLIQYSIAI